MSKSFPLLLEDVNFEKVNINIKKRAFDRTSIQYYDIKINNALNFTFQLNVLILYINPGSRLVLKLQDEKTLHAVQKLDEIIQQNTNINTKSLIQLLNKYFISEVTNIILLFMNVVDFSNYIYR